MRRDKAIAYFKLARYQAELMSKDESTKVGSIILAPESLQCLSFGYNGMPRNIDETVQTRWQRPTKYKYVEHAERNAIYNACRSGTCLNNSICVVTMFPCCDCARGLIQTGIKEVVTLRPDMSNSRWADDFKLSQEMFGEAGVKLLLLDSHEIDSCDPVTSNGTL